MSVVQVEKTMVVVVTEVVVTDVDDVLVLDVDEVLLVLGLVLDVDVLVLLELVVVVVDEPTGLIATAPIAQALLVKVSDIAIVPGLVASFVLPAPRTFGEPEVALVHRWI
jgi:hypothetical protein